MYKGKGIWAALAALAAVGIGIAVYGGDDDDVVASGTLLGEGDVKRYHWRVRKEESTEEGFADRLVGEISPDKEEWTEVAEGARLPGVKGLTIEAIALMPGFSG